MSDTAPTLYFRVGGDPFFERLVDAFYRRVADDEVLLPLYPEQPDLTGARERLTMFLVQYWGGPATYTEQRGHPRLRMRHMKFEVGPLQRDRWLAHMGAAVDEVCADGAMPVIEVADLTKRYGDVVAVDGVSFEVREGEVYALLGENGAGKSTTVEILEGYREATSGDVTVFGVDPATADREYRDRIGIVLQESGIETEFSVREVIELYGGCYRNRRGVDELVEMVGLSEKVDARIGSLSGGQKRRIDLALGIVGHPDMLFLDEPTTGFDPSARRRSWGLVERLGTDGATILLTTHYLDEAEHLADRVGVLSKGRLVAEGTPEQLINQVSGTVVGFMLPEAMSTTDALSTFGPLFGAEVRVAGRLIEATIEQPTAAVHRLTGWAIESGVELESLTVKRASLEDVYLALVDGEAAAADHTTDADAADGAR